MLHLSIFLFLLLFSSEIYARDRWTEDQVNAWWANLPKTTLPKVIGGQFLTSSATNQIEMWQASTFDADLIDKELSLAGELGYNTMRIFLHDLPYAEDPTGFKNRMETVLQTCAKYGVKPTFAIFTGGPIANPTIGKQPKPKAGEVSSNWGWSPNQTVLTDPSKWTWVETYIKDIIGTYANDDRVLIWDLYNEPEGSYNSNEVNFLNQLFPQIFAWARSMNPIQPLTSSVWRYNSNNFNASLSLNEWLQINNSDILSIHNYENPGGFEKTVQALKIYNRPIVATEYMARSLDNEFVNIIPLGQKYNMGLINWGFVNGKIQYNLPWDSGRHPYIYYPPTVWFQDVFRNMRAPYLLEEVQFIKRTNGCPMNGHMSPLNNWTCYNAYSTPLSFSDVQTACKNVWSNTATIGSGFENTDVKNYATKLTNCDKFYVGLYKANDWNWIFSTTGPYNNPTYRNWRAGYPINDATANCVVLNSDGSWTNQDCSTPQCYICSY